MRMAVRLQSKAAIEASLGRACVPCDGSSPVFTPASQWTRDQTLSNKYTLAFGWSVPLKPIDKSIGILFLQHNLFGSPSQNDWIHLAAAVTARLLQVQRGHGEPLTPGRAPLREKWPGKGTARLVWWCSLVLSNPS